MINQSSKTKKDFLKPGLEVGCKKNVKRELYTKNKSNNSKWEITSNLEKCWIDIDNKDLKKMLLLVKVTLSQMIKKVLRYTNHLTIVTKIASAHLQNKTAKSRVTKNQVRNRAARKLWAKRTVVNFHSCSKCSQAC